MAVSVLGIDAQRGFYGEMGNSKAQRVILFFAICTWVYVVYLLRGVGGWLFGGGFTGGLVVLAATTAYCPLFTFAAIILRPDKYIIFLKFLNKLLHCTNVINQYKASG